MIGSCVDHRLEMETGKDRLCFHREEWLRRVSEQDRGALVGGGRFEGMTEGFCL